jgi:hypothetical protein
MSSSVVSNLEIISLQAASNTFARRSGSAQQANLLIYLLNSELLIVHHHHHHHVLVTLRCIGFVLSPLARNLAYSFRSNKGRQNSDGTKSQIK